MINWRDCIVPIDPNYWKRRPPQAGSKPRHTLCEFCANACGGCRWSMYQVQEPVPGWTAVRFDISPADLRTESRIESYIVLDCPQFALEDRWAEEYGRFGLERAYWLEQERKETGK